MPDPLSPVIQAALAYRAELARREAPALSRLIQAYGRSFQRLLGQLDALILAAGDEPMTRGQLIKSARYKSLVQQIAEELRDMQALTGQEIQAAARVGVELGEAHGRGLIAAYTGRPEIAGMFNVLPREAVETLLGFLDPQGPLFDNLRQLAPVNTQYVADAIVDGVTLGKNPSVIARSAQAAFGRGLTDSLRFVRTVQLWSYREANRASYAANSDVVEGWVWHAELGPRTCASCFANHGKVYPLSQPLNDHHNGRCAMIPLVRGFENPVKESGEDWFSKQPEAFQRQVLGNGKYEAWKGGKFGFDALSSTKVDSVYGEMRIETPLKELVEP